MYACAQLHTFTRASSLSTEDTSLSCANSLGSSLSRLGVDVQTPGLGSLLPSGDTIGELSGSQGGGTVAGIMACKQDFTSSCSSSNLFLALS